MHIVYDIMMNLEVIFGDQNHDDRQDRINIFLNTKMTKDPKSSYRWKNPDRYGVHIVARVLQVFPP